MSDKNALKREEVAVGLLEPNPRNPNKMSARAFNLLVENIQKTKGVTEAIVVRPLANGRYRIISGHHRWEAAKFLGYATVPVTIITDPDFDEEAEEMQLVRHNAIRGQIDPNKFFELYSQYAGKYGDDVLQDMMGFAEAAEFQRLIKQTAKTLPKEMQKTFLEAAEEIKTIDGLSKLLNQMFTKYGDTLPYGYMVFDYGGKRSMWLRVSNKTLDALDLVGKLCIDKKRTVDDVVGQLLQLIAKGELTNVVDQLVGATPEVELPATFGLPPTKDNIDKVSSL